MYKVAVLITSHNRAEITIRGLDALYENRLPDDLELDVYLVDDGSTDDTSARVRELFPTVYLIHGNGRLYWAGGTRLAWQEALNVDEYDFFLLLNDDVVLYSDALKVIFGDWRNLKIRNMTSLLVGVFKDPVSNSITYSGCLGQKKLEPNGYPQSCDNITGNCLLVPRIVFERIGILSNKYTHGIADTEYALRALKAGFSCHILSRYIGECSFGKRLPWYHPSYSILERWRNAKSVTRGNLPEYICFVKRQFGPIRAFFVISKSLLALFFPNIVYRNIGKADVDS